MREYALVVLNSVDQIIDKFNLDVVTSPTNNGFKLNLSTITSDIEDVITKVTQIKNVIKLTVNQYQNSYAKSNTLASWIQKYSTAKYKMALEYNDGNIVRYCEGKVTSLAKTELDQFKNLAQDLEFTQVTPFFVKKENLITIRVSAVGKSYPYKYPYSYGSQNVENNEINNSYILDVPLILQIHGAIDNPTIDLLDESGERYSRVQFSGINIDENETLVINSAQRKIYKIDSNGDEIDFVSEVNPVYDTFLRASSGISTININTNDTGTGFVLIGGWRQYLL